MEWELSKENVQPLRNGRKVEPLNMALKMKAAGATTTRANVLEHQRRKMIEAIDEYEGDDPLEPWLEYIMWVKDAFPSGGIQSELLPLLEACTRTFQTDERYRSDLRYLRVWVQYADSCTEPKDIYAFLEANSIGQDHALYYEAFATYLEIHKNYKRANEIFELGIARGAHPIGRLQNMYQAFLKRMARRTEHDLHNQTEEELLRLCGSNQGRGSNQQMHKGKTDVLPHDCRPANAGFEVFTDDEFQVGRSFPPVQHPSSTVETAIPFWQSLGSQKEVKKENTQQPAKWTEGKVCILLLCSMQVHNREKSSGLHSKNKEAVVPASLRLRLDDMPDHRRDTETLKKNPLLHFTEGDCPTLISQLGKTHGRSPVRDDSDYGSTGSAHLTPVLIGSVIYKHSEKEGQVSFEEFRLAQWCGQDSPAGALSSSIEKAKRIEMSLNKLGSASDCLPSQGMKTSVREGACSPAGSCKSILDQSPAAEGSLLPPRMPRQIASAPSANGDETIAIKRFADQLIFQGVVDSDAAGHQGLVDPTINTKEASEYIISQFNRPLSCGSLRDKSKTSTARCQDKEFEILVDSLDSEQDLRPQHQPGNQACTNRRSQENKSAISNNGGSFDIFVDDELMTGQLGEGQGMKHQEKIEGLKVFEDAPYIERPKQKLAESKNSGIHAFVDEEAVPSQTTKKPIPSFEVFEDNNSADHPVHKIMQRQVAGQGTRSFEIFRDENDVQAKKNPVVTNRTVKKPSFQTPSAVNVVDTTQSKPRNKGFEVFTDQENLDLDPPLSKATSSKAAEKKRSPLPHTSQKSFSVFVDE
ncbi:unnamed protein product [Sphagnum troendelagicum]|uniref:BUB1 N-terminal domain-containing protein n=1 Tax=Sphagnum troendelagicum TaxID=128251 RepID=A0ABP0T9F3_9BRYO